MHKKHMLLDVSQQVGLWQTLALCAADSLPSGHHIHPFFHSPGHRRRGHLRPAPAALPGLEQPVRALLAVSQELADMRSAANSYLGSGFHHTGCGWMVE